MRTRVLDTSILINWWRDCFRRDPAKAGVEAQTAAWGRKLGEMWNTQYILTPIYIEFICGARSARELKSMRAFLEEFKLLDEGLISQKDWEEARRIAQRVPLDGNPRQLGDCLIRAICIRLNADFQTFDRRFPR